MKLWQKKYKLDKEIEAFTVGNDFMLDQKLVYYDCIASKAHASALYKAKILTKKELVTLEKGLNEIIALHKKNKFEIKQKDEDCHTAIENFLTKKYGAVGKKIHTARSRNDQVLTTLRLYEKEELKEIKKLIEGYQSTLKKIAKKYGKTKIPGYTHMQKAMPTNIKTWLGCFEASTKDNIQLLDSAYKLIDQSPLGTAAGFGVPVLKIDRKLTAKKLGFAKVQQNPLYAQMSRGKFEATIIHVLGQIMFDLNKLASDLILFNMTEFGFVDIPDEFCTGSSIMPQKKNPDVLELVRAKYHVVLGEQMKVQSLIANVMLGYNRDVQLTKEPLINSIETTKACLSIITLILSKLKIEKKACEKAMTKELYATEEAYKLVKQGLSFRDAYKKVSRDF